VYVLDGVEVVVAVAAFEAGFLQLVLEGSVAVFED
jgi:hypothetical protein